MRARAIIPSSIEAISQRHALDRHLKGFGALAAAYVFAAFASRGVARMQKAAERTL